MSGCGTLSFICGFIMFKNVKVKHEAVLSNIQGFVQRLKRGEKFVFCTCVDVINIAHCGRNYITNHVKCLKHVGYVKSQEENSIISSFFNTANAKLDVTKAEFLLVLFLVLSTIFHLAQKILPMPCSEKCSQTWVSQNNFSVPI
ncbi:hypothetical protein PR048_020421 [Dryococelus australis]|uniref:Uncharacterized protein n=1 Tax=Dryococelus australis TaxID=614101 RepID=A0ABQ9H689_9NEOP|nr:hypothetical protein PR048_020421 [Dryococelus australis]